MPEPIAARGSSTRRPGNRLPNASARHTSCSGAVSRPQITMISAGSGRCRDEKVDDFERGRKF